MTTKRPSTAFKVSTAYFSLVMVVLLWYESSLGKTEFGGLIPGLLLVFITMPGSAFGGSVAAFFGCASGSLCEHLTAILFAGGLNTLGIYAALRINVVRGKKRDKA